MTPAWVSDRRVLALTVAAIWGFNMIAVKIGVESIPPLFFLALRFMAVSLLVVPFMPLPRGRMKGLIGLGLIMGVGHFGALFWGLSQVDAAVGAVMIQLGPPFSAVLAALLLKDLPGWRRGLGIGLAFVGAAVLGVASAGPAEGGGSDPRFLALLIWAAFAWALGNVLGRHLRDLHPLTVTGWISLLAWPPLLALSFLLEEGQIAATLAAPWTTWAALAYICLGSSIVAYGLWYWLLGRFPVSQVAPFALVAPFISVGAGVALLGETLSTGKLLGGALVLAGVIILELRLIRRGRTPEVP
ncbi:DMT family transporter [Roseospirillum parvum]|uniref:O-acetylserine/cysteine efflux transporter n=1 Tax=Roseospirillum parvum TaxID=83401 RepID=A0A1G7TJK7_9PROT|nr:EamA family transporter [Roseospirillum parvum]SDG34839.1 O-acetylserine/cysteine efflux transporter [Roseospirillum parvum]